MNSILIDSTSKRRDKLSIIAEVVEISKTGALKTQIMYKANLSFAQLGEYLKLLEKINLLQKRMEDGKETYAATEKGFTFLQKHREIMTLLNGNSENGTDPKTPPKNPYRKP